MDKKIVQTPLAPQAIGPYSQAIVAGQFVFVSGQISIDPKTGSVVHTDVKSQTRLIIENATAILGAAGCSLSSVVKTTIYLKSMDNFAPVNEVYGGYFAAEPPARATVEVSRLPKDVDVEIDFIAWTG